MVTRRRADHAVLPGYGRRWQPEARAREGLTQATGPQPVLLLIAVCLLVPFVEDLLFRGVLYTYPRRWGLVPTLVASSPVFGAFHSSMAYPCSSFTNAVAGALFTLAYERSGSLWPAMVAHATMSAAVFAGGRLPGV